MRTVIVIPARYASTRLPGKPLLSESGKPLICHVVEQAMKCSSAAAVVVATDDERIQQIVEAAGSTAVMTRPDHPSGTDRIAEAVAGLEADIVVNLQGDEPQFDPAGVDLLVGLLVGDPVANMSTLAAPIRDLDTYNNPSCVKVVADGHGRALYFSRSPVPYVRDGVPDFADDPPQFLLHVGVYAYRRDYLLKLAATPPHPLEQLEKLEQLRALGTGGVIRVGIIPHAHRGIDTPADYAAFVEAVRGRR